MCVIGDFDNSFIVVAVELGLIILLLLILIGVLLCI